MKISVKVQGDFVNSVKKTKFELEMKDSINMKEAVIFIFDYMEKNGDSMNIDDVIVSLDGYVTDPEKWELMKVKNGQVFTFFPPLSGG